MEVYTCLGLQLNFTTLKALLAMQSDIRMVSERDIIATLRGRINARCQFLTRGDRCCDEGP